MWAAFQKALFECLTDDTVLMALLKGDGVFDYVDPEIPMPFVTIGDDMITDWDDKFQDGGEITAMIHIWSDYDGSKSAKQIADQIRSRLRNTKISLAASSGYDAIATGRQSAPAVSLREDDGTRHIVLQYKFLIEEVN